MPSELLLEKYYCETPRGQYLHGYLDKSSWYRAILASYTEENDRELSLEEKAKLGTQLISQLPETFKKENRGKFIAIEFDGKVLSVSSTLEGLDKELEMYRNTHQYFLAQLGSDSLAQID